MANVPEEGLSITSRAYCKTFIFEMLKRHASGLPIQMIEGIIDAVVQDMYSFETGMFLVRANDDAHRRYVLQTLSEYAPRPEVRYPITLRALRKEDVAKYTVPEPAPEDLYEEAPEPELPSRG